MKSMFHVVLWIFDTIWKKKKEREKKGKKGEKMIKTFICIYICITLVKKSGTVIWEKNLKVTVKCNLKCRIYV